MDPFNSSQVAVLDAIRVVTIVASVVIAGWLFPIALRIGNSRKWGCFSLMAYALFAAFFEFQRLGERTVSIGLLFIVLGTIFGFIYCYQTSRHINRH